MKQAPTVVIVAWQRSEHGIISLRYVMLLQLPSSHANGQSMENISLGYIKCSGSYHRLMTTARAWLYSRHVCNMLRQLSSSNDNGQSMMIYPLGMKHAPTVVTVSRQRREHGNISLRYETCSDSCNLRMTTVTAWKMYPLGMKHALTVVIVSWQRSEHGY